MTDVAAAAARSLRAGGEYVIVTGRPTAALQPLIAAAHRHAVAAGASTRLAVAAGVELGGHRAVVAVEPGCAFGTSHAGVAVAESRAAARAALRHGWSIVQPATGDDVATLLDVAPRPALVLLADAAEAGDFPPNAPPLAATGMRAWQDGGLATLAAAGAAVAALVRIAARLATRGVAVAAVEVAVLSSAEQAPLIGGDALYVGDPQAADRLGGGGWHASLKRVDVSGVADADLVGGVLSLVRTT